MIKAGPFGSSLKKESYTASGYRVYGQEQVIAGDFSIGDYYIDEAKYDKLKSCDVRAGDVLVSLVGSFGKVVVVPDGIEPGIINPRLLRLSFCHDHLDPQYFMYYFKSPMAQKVLEMNAHGGTMGVLNAANLKELPIPLPPLPEQKRIAAILDKADAIRRKRQEAIKLTEQFLRSVFLDMFGDPVTNPMGWPCGTIRDLVLEVKYGTSGKADETGPVPILRMNNITYVGTWDLSELKYIDLPAKDADKYLVSNGDLLFNRTNSKELVGKCAVYRGPEPMAFAGYLIRARTNELACTDYIAGYLNSYFGKTKLRHMCKSIVGMANINAQELQNIDILIPPREEQRRYTDLVVATLRRAKQGESAAQVGDKLFNSLVQRAFRGEL